MAGTFDSLQTLNTDIAQILGSWQDRLRETCEMKSPDGNKFSPLWAGSPRSFTKKLGRFNFPKVKGTYIQDLDVSGDVYPMTVFFEGKDHDKDANKFFIACKERGRWSVTHPVHGLLSLQLSSVEEQSDPIGSGNITAFTLEFLESINLEDIGKIPNVKALTEQQIFLTNAAHAFQLVNKAITDTFAAVAVITDTLESAQIIINTVLSPLRTLSNSVNDAINGINTSITNTLNAAILDPLMIAGQFQQLIQLPSLIITNIDSKINLYEKIIDQVFELEVDSINGAATVELITTACITAIAQSSINGSINSRSEAMNINDNIYNTFIGVTDNLDAYQVLFRNLPIEKQYFSQTPSFTDTTKLVALAIRNINSQIFNLAVERRFKLKKCRSTWEIAVNEYQGTGKDDANIYKYIETNNLHGKDILILPPGREVVIYAN
jgi:hypothetical protein